jgi:glycosyltransferase involved in cell wall biosynthesis
MEIIVVDAGSNDGSVEIVEKMGSPGLKQIISPGCSEPAGEMLGISESRNPIIMLTNSDCYVPRDWTTKHIAWLTKGFDAVGGIVFWGGDNYTFTWNNPSSKEPEINAERGTGLGFSNTSMRKTFYDRMGGFKNIRSQHDAEFTFRILRKGAKIVVDPTIQIYHDHPYKSVKSSYRRAFTYTNNFAIIREGQVMLSARMVGADLLKWYGVKTYYEHRRKAHEYGMDKGLFNFLVARFFGLQLGQLHGSVQGTFSRKRGQTKVTDTHFKLT